MQLRLYGKIACTSLTSCFTIIISRDDTYRNDFVDIVSFQLDFAKLIHGRCATATGFAKAFTEVHNNVDSRVEKEPFFLGGGGKCTASDESLAITSPLGIVITKHLAYFSVYLFYYSFNDFG